MARVRVYRCRICGDPYIGTEAPSRCPFCGALSEYFIEAVDWNPKEFLVDLTTIERKNLEAALQLELDNAAFYDCAKAKADQAHDEYHLAKFKALMKVEREHASAISKFLKISSPDLEKKMCSMYMNANTKEGWERENRAIKAYTTFRDEATSPRLKEFFNALVEIEKDHLALHAEHLKK